MLSQEFVRAIKSTLFVKNNTQIISVVSSTPNSRQFDVLRNLMKSNILQTEKASLIIDQRQRVNQNSLESQLKTNETQIVFYEDLSLDLEFGYFAGAQSHRKLLSLRKLSSESTSLSKKFLGTFF